MQVCDLFCGLGGFSAGAIEAGAEVILGVDRDSVPLKLWAANVPGGRAKLATLGVDCTIDLPPPSPSLHIHSSPPCTDLSPARGGNVPAADVEAGLHMIRWALDLVIERGDFSWSLENVSVPRTREVLAEYAARFPELIGWTTLDAAEFGAAQTRIRLIAGPPRLIAVLLEMPSARRVSVREVFETRGLELPATHFKNQTRNRNGNPCLRSVENQAFTVCASHALTWSDRDGATCKGDDTKRVGPSDGVWIRLEATRGVTRGATSSRECVVRGNVPGGRAGRVALVRRDAGYDDSNHVR